MTTILLIVLIILAIGAFPSWGYHGYGYFPSSVLGLILAVLLILMVTGYLPR